MIRLHYSELAIDRMIAGETDAVDAAALRDHAASCPQCSALLDDALATQRSFLFDRPPLGLPIPLRRRRIAPAVVAVTALAAALALIVAWPHGEQVEVRTKGRAIVGTYVLHGDQVRRGSSRETVVPGDRIELFTTTFAPAWFAAVGVDAAGHRTVYVEPRVLESGDERLLPLSIELDDTLGNETVTAVFCAEPFEVSSIPADCAVDRFTWVKVPR